MRDAFFSLLQYAYIPDLGVPSSIAEPRSVARLEGAPIAGIRPSGPRLDDHDGTVRLERVSKTFHTAAGEVQALADVSLSVSRGEVFGIIGRSGAGKSTLIRTINRLETPDRGRVVVGGRDIGELADHELTRRRRAIGMIFQHFNLLSAKTVFENVALPLRIAGLDAARIERKVSSLLDLVGLADKRDAYPAKLSGGQKQRVGIARALVHDPDILLCDEATSALDPETTLSILGLLKNINRRLGLTIVLITHEMQVVREICDTVAVIESGRIVETGPVWQVFANPQEEVTRRLLRTGRDDLPSFITDRLRPMPAGAADALVRLRFAGDAAYGSALADLARQPGGSFSVVHGTVDHIQNRPFGNLVIALPADVPEVLARLLAFLRSRVALVEVLGYVARTH